MEPAAQALLANGHTFKRQPLHPAKGDTNRFAPMPAACPWQQASAAEGGTREGAVSRTMPCMGDYATGLIARQANSRTVGGRRDRSSQSNGYWRLRKSKPPLQKLAQDLLKLLAPTAAHIRGKDCRTTTRCKPPQMSSGYRAQPCSFARRRAQPNRGHLRRGPDDRLAHQRTARHQSSFLIDEVEATAVVRQAVVRASHCDHAAPTHARGGSRGEAIGPCCLAPATQRPALDSGRKFPSERSQKHPTLQLFMFGFVFFVSFHA